MSYGGKVVGESAMKRVEDIGNEVVHKYFVSTYHEILTNSQFVFDISLTNDFFLGAGERGIKRVRRAYINNTFHPKSAAFENWKPLE